MITGQFDPTRHRAIWPSTGNYARGGVAISRIMGCRGGRAAGRDVAGALRLARPLGGRSCRRDPHARHREQRAEIYDACHQLAADPTNFVLNQFAELGNHLGHYEITGRALAHVFDHVRGHIGGDLRLAALRRPPDRPEPSRRGPAEGAHGTRIVAGGARVPDDARRTASVSTTSRASATSTSR